MESLSELLCKQEDFIAGSGVSEEDITCAEEKLGIKFSSGYRAYLLKFGLVSFDGRELTGLGRSKRTDVVEVTKELWSKSDKIPHYMYVIEDAGIDGLMFLQDSNGIVYQLIFGNEPEEIFKSMLDFIAE